MANVRTFTKRDERVLKMLRLAADKVEKITEPVDPHKRFNREDLKDPYGRIIEWVYFSGTGLFRD